MDGVQAPASGRARRLLRRGVLVATLAGAGWLLGVLFAGTASATPAPPSPVAEQPATGSGAATTEFAVKTPVPAPLSAGHTAPAAVEPQELAPPPAQTHPGGGLLGGLLGGLTNAVNALTQSVADTLDDTVSILPAVLAPSVDDPVVTLPALPQLLPDVGDAPEVLPADDTGARAEVVVPAAPRAPPATPATPTTPATALAPEHTPRPAMPVASPQRMPVQSGGSGAAKRAAEEHATESPAQPVKVPAPAAPGGGSTISTTHDNSGGARGTHGVLSARTPPVPHSAGFTTRSRAADVSGRIAGLPATSPD